MWNTAADIRAATPPGALQSRREAALRASLKNRFCFPSHSSSEMQLNRNVDWVAFAGWFRRGAGTHHAALAIGNPNENTEPFPN